MVKLVADEAYERARRSGRFSGTLEDFQSWPGTRRVRALRSSRTAALQRAAHVFVPSAYLRDVALGWGLAADHVTVLPNPAPRVPALPPRGELRAGAEGARGRARARVRRPAHGAEGARRSARRADSESREPCSCCSATAPSATGSSAGRASSGSPTASASSGAETRDEVLRLFAAADAAVLSSAWENFPHTVVEALAVGTPVVATAVGGVPEIVRDGVNGLLVPAGDPTALGTALRRIVEDDGLRRRLAAAAAPSVEPLAEDVLLGAVERKLVGVVG